MTLEFDFREALRILSEFPYLHDTRNTEFFSKNVPDRFPAEWSKFMLSFKEPSLTLFNEKSCDDPRMPEDLRQLIIRMAKCNITLPGEPQEMGRMVGVKEKKAYELMRTMELLKHIIPLYKITRIVDVGCGLGHLLKFMSQTYPDIEYVGVEMNPKMCQKALHELSNVKFTCHQVMLNDETPKEVLQEIFDAPNHTTLIVSLHGCGKLHPFLLRTFASIQSESNPVMITLPCCYHKLSIREISVTDFAMSNKLKRLARHYTQKLHDSTIRLASQPRLIRELDTPIKLHEDYFFHRGVHEMCRNDKVPIKKHYKLCDENYCEIVPALGVDLTVYDRVVQSKRPIRPLIEPFTALQMRLSAVVESLILKDRTTFMEENGCVTRLFPLFDARNSPRNMCMLTVKESEWKENTTIPI